MQVLSGVLILGHHHGGRQGGRPWPSLRLWPAGAEVHEVTTILLVIGGGVMEGVKDTIKGCASLREVGVKGAIPSCVHLGEVKFGWLRPRT